MDNCRQNINRDISNNQNTFSTDDKSQKLIKDSNGINSIFVAVNTETTLQETFNVAEALSSPPPNTIRINKTNPNEVNVFFAARSAKGNKFSKT